MIKSYLIAFGIFIVGLILAVFWGKQKQAATDKTKAASDELRETSNVIAISKDTRSNIARRPASGPDSAASELHNDWQVKD